MGWHNMRRPPFYLNTGRPTSFHGPAFGAAVPLPNAAAAVGARCVAGAAAGERAPSTAGGGSGSGRRTTTSSSGGRGAGDSYVDPSAHSKAGGCDQAVGAPVPGMPNAAHQVYVNY